MVNFVFKIKKFLDHGFVFFRINYYGATKCLQNKTYLSISLNN